MAHWDMAENNFLVALLRHCPIRRNSLRLETNIDSMDISPIAFSLSLGGLHFAVRWYGLFFASTFVYGIVIFRYIYRNEGRPPDDVYDLVLYVIPAP